MRYVNKQTIRSTTSEYLSEKRMTPTIRHYPTLEIDPTFDKSTVEYVDHIWKSGDKFYKLSNQYYGDTNMWWVIAWFNNTPTEFDVK